MKKVALYARVSNEEQEREETIESQLSHLQRLVSARGLSVLDRHIYLDEGYSGDLMARPSLDRLRDDVRDGLIDLVLVHCPDRLARRYPYQVVLIEELEGYGCEVDFVNREIARTPEDQMLLSMQGVIAEYERAKIMERSRRGRLHKLQKGVLIIPNAPFGYRWVPRQGSERGRIEVVTEQADLVWQIFQWVAKEGLPIIAVTRRLMKRCIPAPRGGHRWGTSTIQNMLRNRAYIGEFCMNRIMAVEPKQPPKPGVYRRRRNCATQIRPPDEWIVVPGPSIVDREIVVAGVVRNHQLLLRCLLRCGCCGYSIIATWTKPRGRTGQVFRYYICLKRSQPTRYGDCVTKCSLEPLNADVIDDIVWNDLRDTMSDPERIARYAGLDEKATCEPLLNKVNHLKHQIQSCERQVRRLVDAYQCGAVEIDDLITRREQIESRRSLLADALKQAEASLKDDKVRHAIRARLPDLVCQVKQGLESADFQTRQQLVRLLIDCVVVQPNLDIEIHYALRIRAVVDEFAV